MDEKKNLDKLFQERLQHYESVPDEHVWANLETRLNRKQQKRRRVIPLWFRYGGVAAILLLFLGLGYNAFFTEKEEQTQPTLVEQETNRSTPETNIPSTTKEDIVDSPLQQDSEASSITIVDNTESPSTQKQGDTNTLVNEAKPQQSNGVVVSQNQQKKPTNSQHPSNQRLSTAVQKKEAIAQVEEENLSSPKQNSVQETVTPFKNSDALSKEAVAAQKTDVELKSTPKAVQDQLKEATTNESRVAQNEETSEKPSLEEVAKQQELDKIFETNDLDKVEVAESNRWRVGPKVAPVYFNTLENGSPIHSQFANNTKTGDINMSYGVNVAYAVSSRFKVRSGVNILTVGYGTESVTVQPEIDAVALPTLSYAENAQNVSVRSTSNSRATLNPTSLESDVENLGAVGTMNQQMNYIEVPLEMSYALVNKKIGINLIAGASTLFLTDNSVSVESESLTTEVGEANNLNDVSFSANAGIGIDYNISEKLQLNVEPVFKYQLNTFSNADGNFRPYQLGVYTGVSFKF